MPVQPCFEIISESGDVALVIHGRNLDNLVDCACRAYAALIVEGAATVRIRCTRTLAVRHEGDAALAETLVRFLNELIYLTDTEGFIPAGAVILQALPSGEIAIAVRGDHYDPARHERGLLVKAATYHELDLQKTEAGFAVRVLLDL